MRTVAPSIETFSGLYLDYTDPQPDQIDVRDIARALSYSCRWAGHCSRYYSVAEHAVRVRDEVLAAGYSPAVCLAALHHDSHEAYVGDWPTPLKRVLDASGYRDLVDRIDVAIAKKLGIDPVLLDDKAVVDADTALLWREAATLKVSGGHGPHWAHHEPVKALCDAGWPPAEAEATFLLAHYNDMEAHHATR